jgi:formate C-acetyltransferase
MAAGTATDSIRSKLVVKAVRNIRKAGRKEDAEKGMYRPGIRLDLKRSILLTESYRETEGEPMVLRRAKALERILTGMDLYIQDHERIVGNSMSAPEALYFGIDMNWRSVRRIVEEPEASTLLDEEGRRKLDELIGYWKGRSMSDIQQKMFTGEVLDYWKMSKMSAGSWSHWSELGIPNYEKVFRVGLRGLIREAEVRLAEIDRIVPLDYIDQKEFLQAVIIALKAVVAYAGRYAEMARTKAGQAADPEDRKRLETIARICEKVPEHPPETLHEALQSFFILHVVRYLEYSTLGIGVRFDKVFGPYVESDIRHKRITREEALELLQLLWVKFHELGLIYSPTLSAIYGGVASLQAITLGGVDEEGNDVLNEMTYLVLETALTMRTPEPSIVIRYHDGTRRELLDKAADVIRTGIGYPSFFNDKALLPLLEGWNVPLKDARDYAVTGCVYIELPGKNIARRALGGMNLPLALTYAMTQGVNPLTGEQVGARTPDPLTFRSADDVMEAYLEQVRFAFQRLCTVQNICQSLYEKYLPRPFYSALLDGCVERGQDCRKWGYPSAVSDFCIILGPSNVADSIAALKKVVFEDRKVSMKKLLEAMAANWEGYEEVRRLMLRAPKYGNDDDYVDRIAVEVHHRTAEVMMGFRNRFGYPCRGDGSGISATYASGAVVPATPDGRRAGEPLADATLSPVFGMDREGPTAVLKSASKVSTVRTHNHLLNQKFLPQALEGERKELFIQYLRAWGDLGVSQIQFNVVDRQTLIDAQARPSEHANLLVRVAGYSAYFVDLSRGLQDSIIARTEQRL